MIPFVLLVGWVLFRGAHSWTVPWPPYSSVPPGWYPQISRYLFLTLGAHFWRQTVITMLVGKKISERKLRRYFEQWDGCWSWTIDSYLFGFVCQRHLKYVLMLWHLSSRPIENSVFYRTSGTIRETCNNNIIIPPPCLFMSLASLFIFCYCGGFLCVVTWVYFPRWTGAILSRLNYGFVSSTLHL